MAKLIAVMLGGAFGSAARYLLTLAAAHYFQRPFLGTLAVNVIGSFLMVLLAAPAFSHQLSTEMRLLLLTGIMGGFTTFSAFNSETLQWILQGQWGAALVYMVGTIVLCLGGGYAGLRMGQALW